MLVFCLLRRSWLHVATLEAVPRWTRLVLLCIEANDLLVCDPKSIDAEKGFFGEGQPYVLGPLDGFVVSRCFHEANNNTTDMDK